MVRLRQRQRFHTPRGKTDPDGTGIGSEDGGHVHLRRRMTVRNKRIQPRSVTWLVVLFIIVLMAIVLLG